MGIVHEAVSGNAQDETRRHSFEYTFETCRAGTPRTQKRGKAVPDLIKGVRSRLYGNNSG